MGRPHHLVGVSTAFSWTLPPLQFMETFRLGAPASPPDSLRAPQLPHPRLYLLLGLQLPPPLQSHPQDVVAHGLASFV